MRHLWQALATQVRHARQWTARRTRAHAAPHRWCTLHSSYLAYYESSKSARPKGVVNLGGATVSLDISAGTRPATQHAFQLVRAP